MSPLLREKVPLIGTLSEAWLALLDSVTDPYRPELHYMRGPGPKWRAKQGK
jgi:hypothetical protein